MSKNIQLILCTESDNKNPIDEKYIREIIKRFFILGENKLSFVHLSGKNQYKHVKKQKLIHTLIKEYRLTANGESKVIYCMDKDESTVDPRDALFIDEIEKFCTEKSHDVVWFVRNIEEVAWGSVVADKDKSRKVFDFIKHKQVTNLLEINLSASNNVNRRTKSNILTILKKYLKQV